MGLGDGTTSSRRKFAHSLRCPRSSRLPNFFVPAYFWRTLQEVTMKTKLLVAALSIMVLSWPKTATADGCSTFGGRATVAQATALGIVTVVLSDTGNLDS